MHNANRDQTKQAGFSMVSALILLSTVSSAILMVSQTKTTHQKAQKSIKVKQSYSDVNQSLVTDLVGYLHEAIDLDAGCFDVKNIKARLLQGTTQYSFTTTVTLDAASPPQLYEQAKNRCPHVHQPSNPRDPLDNRFYFCVQLSQDRAAPSDSILNARMAFAEVAVELIDLQTQKPVSCEQYKIKRQDGHDGSAGMAVTTAFYWELLQGNQSVFAHKALSYIANQNSISASSL